MTLAEARDFTEFLVDDVNNKRFSTSDVDLALQGSVSSVIDDLTNKGQTHFIRHYAASSDSSGQLDLSSLDPRGIYGVSVAQSNNYFPIPATDYWKKARADQTVRSLEIAYVPRHVFPTTTSHPLIGSTTTPLGSWRTLDHLACAKAAKTLLVRNGEINPALEAMIRDHENTVMTSDDIPRDMAPPGRMKWFSEWIMWAYDRENKTVQLLIDSNRVW